VGIHPTLPKMVWKSHSEAGPGVALGVGVLAALSVQHLRRGQPHLPHPPLTKLATKQREVLLQQDPLLDFLSVGDGSLVDC